MTTTPNSRRDRPRILCVDDEQHVLDALGRILHRHFDITTAPGPERALELMGQDEAFAVIMSDLQMPGLDGVSLLAAARTRAPSAVRVLLTGQADLETAIDAVNDGHVFQFLRKPCPPDVLVRTLQAAVEQHRLVTAERELLEQTLCGSVKMLTDVLALANPTVFGRAERVQRVAGALADHLSLPDRWSVEIAATVWHLGCVTLPPPLADKVGRGLPLTPDEIGRVAEVPAAAWRLIAEIPRLERVRELLAVSAAPCHADAPLAAQVLRAALELDTLEARGGPMDRVFAALDIALAGCDPRVLDGIRAVRGFQGASSRVLEMRLQDITLGMVFADDVVNHAGLLLIARGQEVTMPLIERVRTYWSNDAARERVRMIVPGAAQDGTSDTPADELQDGAPPEPATPRMEAAEVSPEAPPRTGGGSAGRFGWWR